MEIAKCSEEEIISALRKNKIAEADIQATLAKQANTLATTTNTVATESQTVAEEDALLKEWMRIAGEEAETIAIIENTTATNDDTVATVANTSAKGANLGITELLTVAWAKLNAVAAANPFTAFLVVVSALGVAMGKIADSYKTNLYIEKE